MTDEPLASSDVLFAACFGILARLGALGTSATVQNGGDLRTIDIAAHHDEATDLVSIEVKANGAKVFEANAPRADPRIQTVTLHKPGRWQQAVVEDWHHGGAPRGAVN